MDDYFWVWAICWEEEEALPYYVRLQKLEGDYPNETLFSLDYGRFKTFEEANNYIETLPEPEEAAEEEAKVFN